MSRPKHSVSRVDQAAAGIALRILGDQVNRELRTRMRQLPMRLRGSGLAATYAGGADEAELQRLREHAGRHRGFLAQGSAFAAEARIRAGLLVPHAELGASVLCGTDAESAARTSRELRPDATGPVPDPVRPRYEEWRASLARELVPYEGEVS